MLSKGRELWWSFYAITAITIVYLFIVLRTGSIPAASEFFGHSLGIAGFLLMIMTETLYSIRKRSRRARWGRMSFWLQFHIFTGLVGPYMVMLHTSWKFNGLAGVVSLLLIIVVASGVIGRYIFTAIPRTADGMTLEASQIEAQIAQIDQRLQSWQATRPRGTIVTPTGPSLKSNSIMLIFGRSFYDLADNLKAKQARSKLPPAARKQFDQMNRLERYRRTLQRQVATLAASRRLMALWHIAHVPLGVIMFTTAIIHILGAIFYATLLR